MAERYAAQRSRREGVRRRSLPRLSDATYTALAEPDDDEAAEALDDDDVAETPGGMSGAAPAARRSMQRPITARRPGALGRTGGLSAATTVTRVDYHYVVRDLKRIAITAVSMLVLLIVLNLILQNLIH